MQSSALDAVGDGEIRANVRGARRPHSCPRILTDRLGYIMWSLWASDKLRER